MGMAALGEARDRLSEHVTDVERTHERVTVTRHGHPAAVLISADGLASLEETLEILDTPGAAQAIREGQADTAAERFADNHVIKARYGVAGSSPTRSRSPLVLPAICSGCRKRSRRPASSSSSARSSGTRSGLAKPFVMSWLACTLLAAATTGSPTPSLRTRAEYRSSTSTAGATSSDKDADDCCAWCWLDSGPGGACCLVGPAGRWSPAFVPATNWPGVDAVQAVGRLLPLARRVPVRRSPSSICRPTGRSANRLPPSAAGGSASSMELSSQLLFGYRCRCDGQTGNSAQGTATDGRRSNGAPIGGRSADANFDVVAAGAGQGWMPVAQRRSARPPLDGQCIEV